MSQFISLEQAVEMTALYQKEREQILKPEFEGKNILVYSETFERIVFDTLLAKPGCEKIRIYYGMDKELKVHAIVVPADAKGHDILPPLGAGVPEAGGDIGEQAVRCPDECPESSLLMK